MSLNIEQIVLTKYRNEFKANQIELSGDSNGDVFISKWSVPDIEQPTREQLLAMDTPELQHMYNVYQFVDKGTPRLKSYLDSVAQQKQYADAISCTSYANSTNLEWKAEAEAFIAWRDSVFNYIIAQQILMQNGDRPIPDFAEFLEELPVIGWP
jgi:hypothetical protein